MSGRHTLCCVALTLVTGGVRSGKSRHAEHLLSEAREVLYVAPGLQPSGGEPDPEWAARVAEHRSRRPAHWRTVETTDLVPLVRADGGPVLVDCLGTWLTAIVDEDHLWDDLDAARRLVRRRGEELADELTRAPRLVVLVTNEVGWSLVPDSPAGRFFQEELGRLNACLASEAARVLLVIAGRVLDLGNWPLAVPPRGDGRPVRDEASRRIDNA